MNALIDPNKFQDPHITAKGEKRAKVYFKQLKTLWFCSGSLCNIECANCYIQSSPTADHFVYITRDEVIPYLDEIDEMEQGAVEIGVTGGEPFLNRDMIPIMQEVLSRGHSLLMLTNAMRPMMRPQIQKGLLALNETYGDRLTMRVSLDHFSQELHDQERGQGSFEIALKGLDWLTENGFKCNIAGRSTLTETEEEARLAYGQLITNHSWKIDCQNPGELVLFPEMDETVDVPEITVACWGILGISPDSMMCANSRMVVRRRDADKLSVLACTLLWDDEQFEMGHTLKESLKPVALNHPHCARFCVLGGASCSA